MRADRRALRQPAKLIRVLGPVQPSGGAPAATALGHKPADEEPPLISFD